MQLTPKDPFVALALIVAGVAGLVFVWPLSETVVGWFAILVGSCLFVGCGIAGLCRPFYRPWLGPLLGIIIAAAFIGACAYVLFFFPFRINLGG